MWLVAPESMTQEPGGFYLRHLMQKIKSYLRVPKNKYL